MKGLGVILVAIGVILMGAAAVSFVTGLREGKAPAQAEVQDKNGQTMAIFPLLGVVSLAAGGALLTAHYVTRKP